MILCSCKQLNYEHIGCRKGWSHMGKPRWYSQVKVELYLPCKDLSFARIEVNMWPGNNTLTKHGTQNNGTLQSSLQTLDNEDNRPRLTSPTGSRGPGPSPQGEGVQWSLSQGPARASAGERSHGGIPLYGATVPDLPSLITQAAAWSRTPLGEKCENIFVLLLNCSVCLN